MQFKCLPILDSVYTAIACAVGGGAVEANAVGHDTNNIIQSQTEVVTSRVRLIHYSIIKGHGINKCCN